MKTQITKLAILLAATLVMSCTKDDKPVTENVATTAPTNVSPTAGKSFTDSEAKNAITFRWTPLVPKPQNVTYRMKVWQLMQGQNGMQAMRSNQPIVVKDVDNVTETTVQSFYNGPCKPPYMCDFVWTIQAIDKTNPALTDTQSTSQATVFNF